MQKHLKFKNARLAVVQKEVVVNCAHSDAELATQVGAILRQLRISRKITQQTLSSSVGLNYRHYQDIETGKCSVRLTTLATILDFYGIELSDALIDASNRTRKL